MVQPFNKQSQMTKTIELTQLNKQFSKKSNWSYLLLSLMLASIQGISQPNTSPPLPIPLPLTTDVLNNNLQVGHCIEVAGAGSCTAKDFKITSIATVNIDDGCSSPSDYMQIDLDVSFEKGAPIRYDVGAWFYRGVDETDLVETDFNDITYANAINGAFCNRIGLEPGIDLVDMSGTSGDIDGDSCTDIAGNAGPLEPMRIDNIILPCRDISSPKDGVTDISACSSWQNNHGVVCNSQFYSEDYPWENAPFPTELSPNTKSKCSCGEFDGGPLVVGIPDISISKVCEPIPNTLTEITPGEKGHCTITITNSGDGALQGATKTYTTDNGGITTSNIVGGFIYQDDYDELKITIEDLTVAPAIPVQPTVPPANNTSSTITVEDSEIYNPTGGGTNGNEALIIFPGTVAAGGSFTVEYDFTVLTTNPDNYLSGNTINNTVCTGFYNTNVADINQMTPNTDLTDDVVFDYSADLTKCADDFVTTPVSISSFKANVSKLSSGYDFRWTTSTEAGNLGFNIYAIVGQTRFKLNKKLIPSHVVDSMEIQEYSYQTNSQFNGLAHKFILEDVDILGKRHSNGVYNLGEQHGVADVLHMQKATDWDGINLEFEKMKGLKNKELAKLINGKFSQKSTQTSEAKVLMEINETGIYKVSYDDLAALGIDLSKINTNEISVKSVDGLVAIDLHTTKNPHEFSKGSYFQFYAKSIESLYTDTNTYTLSFNADEASPAMPEVSATPRGKDFVYNYDKTVTIDRNQRYSIASPIASEPWFDTRLLAVGSPLTSYFNIGANHRATEDAKLSFVYWGGLDFQDDNNDHHIGFKINGEELGTDTFDGITLRNKTFTVPADLLENSNEIELLLPANTVNDVDLVNLESISLTYNSKLYALHDKISFKHENNNFNVAGFVQSEVDIFAVQGDTIVKLKNYKVRPEVNYTSHIQFSGINGEAEYLVVAKDAVSSPALELTKSRDVRLTPTEHLIITHANFMGWSLTNYAKTTRDDYRIVDVQDIYSLYSGNVADAQAIKSFISDIAGNGELKSVLIVGGDTYDYKNYTGLDSISFVPTLYRQTGEIVTFAAVDALYGDIDMDNIPDTPVGRLPVRTLNELKTIIAKSNLYRDQSDNLSVVLAADDSEKLNAYQFKASSNQIATQLSDQDWSVTKAYLDDKSIDEARSDLISAMNDGARLAIYTGHSSSRHWSFDGLFKNTDAKSLTNFNNPLGVIQWGCWNTYFVNPKEDSLGHEFMLAGKQGAAFVVGASTLTDAALEDKFANSFHQLLIEDNESVGSAMIKAKQNFASTNNGSTHKDILWGITILGDPVLKIK